MRKLWLVIAVMLGALLPAAPAGAIGDILFGQQHYYSVTMRGNGESVVTARLLFTNTGNSDQGTYGLTIPGLKVADLSAYQESIVTSCLSYGDIVKPTAPAAGTTAQGIRPCLAYAEPDFTASYAPNATFDKVTVTDKGHGAYELKLAKPVPAGGSGALLISYSGQGYVSQSLGVYTYAFQTLKVGQRVTTSTVALDIDSGLYLVEPDSKVDYQSNKSATDDIKTGAAAQSTRLGNIAYSIGQDGEVSKTGKDLAPGDVLTVKGTYADAAWKLHPWRTGILGLVLLGLLALAVWLVRRALRWRKTRVVAALEAPAKPAAAPKSPTAPVVPAHSGFMNPWAIALGFGSALATALLTWGLVVYMDQATGDVFVQLLSVPVAIVLYVIVLVGPAVWVGFRFRDWRLAVYTFLWQALWLLFVLVVYQIGIKPIFFNPQPVPDQMINGGGAVPL
jgi:hypothetical protein